MLKKFLLILFAAATLTTVPAIVFAGYAPADRQTYTCKSDSNCPSAPDVTFNSITNAPNYGDERTFFDAKDATVTSPGKYLDKVGVHNDQRITLRVYLHNDAAKQEASNAQLQVILPTASKTNSSATAYITADNAGPATVSDTVEFTSAIPFMLTLDKAKAAQITSRPNGQGDYVTKPLSGVQFAGDSTLNADLGEFKAGFNNSALITFTAIVHTSNQTSTPLSAAGDLPNTGAGDVVGLFAGASAAGTAAHMAVTARRRNR